MAGISDQAWAVAMVTVAGLLALITDYRKNDGFYALVIVWALIAIGIEQREIVSSVSTAAYMASFAILLFASRHLLLTRGRSRFPKHKRAAYNK